MKSELKLYPHRITPGENIVEIWDEEEFIATVVGADARGIRIISKHPLTVVEKPDLLNVVEVWVGRLE